MTTDNCLRHATPLNPEASLWSSCDQAARSASHGFLMCPPDYFGVEYSINPFMDRDVTVDIEVAHAEWLALRTAICLAGAYVVEQQPIPHFPDLVFTNNAALISGDHALMTRFHHDERRGETRYGRHTLRSLGVTLQELPVNVPSFEGAADAVPFRNTIVCGHGPRTHQAAVEHIAKFMGLRAMPVQLIDERFYHLDLAFCPLDDRSALIVPAAMDRPTLDRLVGLVPDPIFLEESEALAFCGNSVVIGQTVLMHHVPKRVATELARRGFEAVEVPVGEFLKAGGALRCMSLRLY